MSPTKSRLSILTTVVVLLLSALSASPVLGQATLENPAPNSSQSGIGVISGWACDATRIEIAFNDGPPQEAASGTSRGDTEGTCGDTDNGFGLLFNWNLLGDGLHTVSALADGVEFANVTVIVTTLGGEFLREASGALPLSDFPDPGATRTLRWQEGQQNFVLTDGRPSQGGGTSGAPPHVLENPAPGSFQSGLGLISGWVCDAQTITISFDGGPPQEAAYGTSRGDTRAACGDTDNAFGLLFNWNLLGDGLHTVIASADGVEFARVEVTVTTLGTEFRRGVSREVILTDFPDVGTDVVLQWQEAQQNFVLTTALPTSQLVAVNPVVTLPAGVTIRNVAVRSFYAETAEVLARPEPSLLLAEDGEGTVLLGVANRDGGLLGERDGRVAVSVDSTAVVLVALRAGFAVHEIDQAVVDTIQGHADYADLALTLAVLVEADKNFLDTLLSYPDVVETIETISGIFGANGPHSRRGLSLKYSLEGVASASEAGRVHSPLQGVTGEIDEDDCSHRAALWSMAEGADIAAMFAPVESVAAALRRAATAEQPPPPADPSDPQVTEELSLREIMKFFTDLTAEQHAGRGTGTSSAPETQPAGAGACRDPSAPGDGGREWWDLAMRGYMDHRGTGGAEQENPFLACLQPEPPTNLRITEVGADFVDLAWDAPVGGRAVSYNIYYSTSPTEPEVLIGNVSTAGDRITDTVIPGECYRVSAVSVDGVESEKTAQVCVDDPSSPLTNLNLRVTEVGADFIDLEWDPLPEGEGESYTVLWRRIVSYYTPTTREIGTVEATSVRVRGTGLDLTCFTVKAVSQLQIEDSGDAADRWEEEDVWAGEVCIRETALSSSADHDIDEEGINARGWCWFIGIGTVQSDGRPYRAHQCRGKPWGEPCSATDFFTYLWAEVTRVIVASGQTTWERCRTSRDALIFRYTLEPVPQPDGPPGS